MLYNVLKSNGGFRFGKCWQLSTNDYGYCSATDKWKNATTWEYFGWINIADLSAIQIFFSAFYDPNNRLQIYITDVHGSSQMDVNIYIKNPTTNGTRTSSHLNYGTNHFVYLGFDGSLAEADRCKMVIDDVSMGTTSGVFPTALPNKDFTVNVGRYNAGTYYTTGKLTHWAIRYNRPWVSDINLTRCYSLGKGAFYQSVATFDHVSEIKAPTGDVVNDEIGALHITPAASPGTPQSVDW